MQRFTAAATAAAVSVILGTNPGSALGFGFHRRNAWNHSYPGSVAEMNEVIGQRLDVRDVFRGHNRRCEKRKLRMAGHMRKRFFKQGEKIRISRQIVLSGGVGRVEGDLAVIHALLA